MPSLNSAKNLDSKSELVEKYYGSNKCMLVFVTTATQLSVRIVG